MFYVARDLRDLPSFPTRRSSDLVEPPAVARPPIGCVLRRHLVLRVVPPALRLRLAARRLPVPAEVPLVGTTRDPVLHRRSEEHTSELQSLTNLVCRLLLEKKKYS